MLPQQYLYRCQTNWFPTLHSYCNGLNHKPQFDIEDFQHIKLFHCWNHLKNTNCILCFPLFSNIYILLYIYYILMNAHIKHDHHHPVSDLYLPSLTVVGFSIQRIKQQKLPFKIKTFGVNKKVFLVPPYPSWSRSPTLLTVIPNMESYVPLRRMGRA